MNLKNGVELNFWGKDMFTPRNLSPKLLGTIRGAELAVAHLDWWQLVSLDILNDAQGVTDIFYSDEEANIIRKCAPYDHLLSSFWFQGRIRLVCIQETWHQVAAGRGAWLEQAVNVIKR